jgi:hypothetical protein
MSCIRSPLNGFSANTEGGRLRKQMQACGAFKWVATQGPPQGCPGPATPLVQPTITPAESTRIASLATQCGVILGGSGVTQSRARELLAMANSRQAQFGSEGVRIDKVIQDAVACGDDGSLTKRPIIVEQCPPLPPPPAPPARACPLEKNKKLS